MKVLFIITSFWSYGELLIAMEFANELRKAGNEICFIVPPTHKNNVKDRGYKHVSLVPKSRMLNQIIFNEVKHFFHPDLIILSDFLNYNFAYKHYGITKDDLDIFEASISTFDNYYWSYPRNAMDTYGFKSDILRKVNIDDYGARIVPCPLINPQTTSEEGVYTYSLINDYVDTSDEIRTVTRRKYNFKDDKKIILVPFAKWQSNYIDNEGVSEFIKISNLYFNRLVSKLAEEFIIISIGDIKDIQSDNIYQFKSVPPEKFDELISISDMYLSRNMTSTSMARIALSGVRCISIVNSITDIAKVEKMLSRDEFSNHLRVYKYLMFPVGWYSFLNPIFKDNPYTQLITTIEQFEIDKGIETIREILIEDDISHIKLVNNFKKKLSRLMKPDEIVRRIKDKELEGIKK